MLKSRKFLFFTYLGGVVTMIMKKDGESNNICGKNVREMRLKRHLTQDELASQLQVEGVSITRDAISRIENGSRFVADYELKALSHVLRIPIELLLLEKNIQNT